MPIVSKKVIKEIKKHINIHYDVITTEEKKELTDLCSKLNKENKKISLHIGQLVMIRNSFIYLLSKRVGTFVLKLGENIMKMYKDNMHIIDIAKHYNLPPMSIVCQILMESGLESHKIQKAINKPSLLPDDIQSQMKSIIRHDPMHWYQYKIPKIIDKINKLNCSYVIKQNTRHTGKQPSILFKSACEYNGNLLNWIELKNYILFDDNIFLHDINKTLFNFNRFGHGLILFLDIVCTKSFINKLSVVIDTYTEFVK